MIALVAAPSGNSVGGRRARGLDRAGRSLTWFVAAVGGDRGGRDLSLQLTWWGHATVDLLLDGVRVLTDPLLRRRVGPLHTPYPAPPAEVAGADLVLVSHAHHDHLDLPSLRRLTSGSTVVVPRGAGELVAGVTSGRVAELVVGESLEVRGLRVTGAPAVHPVSRRRGTPPVTPMGFLVTGRRTVYVAGDTDSFAGMADLAGADLALLPVGGWGPNLGPGHLDPRAGGRGAPAAATPACGAGALGVAAGADLLAAEQHGLPLRGRGVPAACGRGRPRRRGHRGPARRADQTVTFQGRMVWTVSHASPRLPVWTTTTHRARPASTP